MTGGAHAEGNFADFGVDTVSFAGPLPGKLAAARAAGFTQAMLSARELVDHAQGQEAALQAVRASGLRVTGLQVLRDFEGLSGPRHAYKVDVAQAMLELCARAGAKLLLVCSTTSPEADTGIETMARDLRKLAMLAVPLGVKVAYEGLSWGRAINEFPQAWDVVVEADMPNLGIALDSFHALAAHTPIDDLDLLDPDKVFLVQLADFMGEARSGEERLAAGCHFRVFPGEGMHGDALAEWVKRLRAIGYRGDWSLEVFNDDYRQMPVTLVAERARRSAVWLGETVLQRAVPLPHAMRRRP